MKNMGTLVALLVLIFQTSIAAQEKSKEAVLASPSQSEIREVNSYKEFLEYVLGKEKLAIQRKESISLRPNESIRIEKEGIDVSLLRPNARLKGGKRVFLGAKNRVAIVDSGVKRVRVLDGKGAQVAEGKLAKLPDAKFAFSDSRFILIGGVLESNGGFEVYDHNGILKKTVNPGYVGGFSVSNQQAYLAVTATSPKSPEYFLLYDMDGNELSRHKVELHAGSYVRIVFSPDDKYVAVDVPEYWRGKYVGYNEKIDKQRKRYVFRIDNSRAYLISEENHD